MYKNEFEALKTALLVKNKLIKEWHLALEMWQMATGFSDLLQQQGSIHLDEALGVDEASEGVGIWSRHKGDSDHWGIRGDLYLRLERC